MSRNALLGGRALLAKHGWTPITFNHNNQVYKQGSATLRRYEHPKFPKHVIHVDTKDGINWQHYDGTPPPQGQKHYPVARQGKGLETLADHLTKSFQYSEGQMNPTEQQQQFDEAPSELDCLLDALLSSEDDEQFAEGNDAYMGSASSPVGQSMTQPKPVKHREAADEPLAEELFNLLTNHSGMKKLSPHEYGSSGKEGRGLHHLHQQKTAIIENLEKKKKKGVYDHEKSKKLWGYLAKSGSDHYGEHYGTKANPATRAMVASKLADHHHKPEDTQHTEEAPKGHTTTAQAEEILKSNRFIRSKS